MSMMSKVDYAAVSTFASTYPLRHDDRRAWKGSRFGRAHHPSSSVPIRHRPWWLGGEVAAPVADRAARSEQGRGKLGGGA